MKNYKGVIRMIFCLMIGIMFISSPGRAYVNDSNEIRNDISSLNELVYEAEKCSDEANVLMDSGDCKVTIKTDDMDIEVTLHDVSRWECLKLKTKALWAWLTGDL